MDISKYTAYFHDGGLIDIEHIGNKICLPMISAEIGEDDLVDVQLLSEDHRLKGKLHLEGVRNIWIDEQPFHGVLHKEYDSGNIFDFKWENHTVILIASWSNYPPKDRYQTDLFCYRFNADRIFWEPKKDLIDPFW